MGGRDKRVMAISAISSAIIVGNIFLISHAWVKNSVWVGIITTVVGLLSMFAWIVALTTLLDSDF